jgi:hypothetical protein
MEWNPTSPVAERNRVRQLCQTYLGRLLTNIGANAFICMIQPSQQSMLASMWGESSESFLSLPAVQQDPNNSEVPVAINPVLKPSAFVSPGYPPANLHSALTSPEPAVRALGANILVASAKQGISDPVS